MMGESGPMLDRGLPCWDKGRIDSRRIHEPLDEIESLWSWTVGRAVGTTDTSAGFVID